MEGRILGIDYGKARIGLALSDPLGITAQPLEVLPVKKKSDALQYIAGLINDRDVRIILIGLPLNMDGSEGAMVTEVRVFSAALAKICGIEPLEWDERLTSAQAISSLALGEKSWKKRKKKVDAVAAQILLQSYLDSL